MKALAKFLALVVALVVTLFLVAQLIHAIDYRSHQTPSYPEHSRSTAFTSSATSSSSSTGAASALSSSGASVASATGGSTLFVAATSAPSQPTSPTGSPAPHSATAVRSSATTEFSVSSVEDEPSSDASQTYTEPAANSTDTALETEQQAEGTGEERVVDDGRLTYSAFTPASAPSRQLCRALAGKASSTVEYGAEGSDDDNEQTQADPHDLRLLLRLEHAEAVVDRVDLHVKINADESRRCISAEPHFHHNQHARSDEVDFDSTDARHGLSRAELTYRMVAHHHALRRGEQHWEKLINFLSHTHSRCAQVAFTLHHKSLACTTHYHPLQLPEALLEGEEVRETEGAGWSRSQEDMREAGHDIVSLLGSLASIISTAASGLTAAPAAILSAPPPSTSPLVVAPTAPASPCSNISFTSSVRLINSTRVHVLYTPHFHHPAIRKVDVVLRNVSGPLLSLRPYRMWQVRSSHLPLYRAVVRMGFGSVGRELQFDYSFRVTLKRAHVTCNLPGGHFSSKSPQPSLPHHSLSPRWLPPTPATIESCPVTDVFNVTAELVRQLSAQASGTSAEHAYKLVLTSHALQLDLVRVHLFVNASHPATVTEGHYRMRKALTTPDDTQSAASGVRWEHTLASPASELAEVEYAFHYRFNETSCDTKARASSVERLLLGDESVGPDEQIKSLFHVLDAHESERVRDEREGTVDAWMESVQQGNGVQVVEAQPSTSSEDRVNAASSSDEQMVAFAAEATGGGTGTAPHAPQAVSVSIDALGRVVPAAAPFAVSPHAGIGPVVQAPYHQYQQPSAAMHATAHAASASAPASPAMAVPSLTAHSTLERQAAARTGGAVDEQAAEWDGGGCMRGDYQCQLTSMCQPCMDRSHPEFCAPCAHVFSCPSEECAQIAVHSLCTSTRHTALNCYTIHLLTSPWCCVVLCVAQTCRLCHFARAIPQPLPQVCHDLC